MVNLGWLAGGTEHGFSFINATGVFRGEAAAMVVHERQNIRYLDMDVSAKKSRDGGSMCGAANVRFTMRTIIEKNGKQIAHGIEGGILQELIKHIEFMS